VFVLVFVLVFVFFVSMRIMSFLYSVLLLGGVMMYFSESFFVFTIFCPVGSVCRIVAFCFVLFCGLKSCSAFFLSSFIHSIVLVSPLCIVICVPQHLYILVLF